MRSRERYFVQYHQRVLATDPIAYWPLNEKVGTVAYDWVSGRVAGAQNGAHTGVTLYQPGIGDGFCCPYYDGANDYTDCTTAAIQAAFNGMEGTVLAWARVSAVGIWTDGSADQCFRFDVNANNVLSTYKDSVNNQFGFYYRAGGGVAVTVNLAGLTTIDWMHIGMTWSRSAGASGEMKAYFAGVQTGATQINIGNWVGNPQVFIGAGSVIPSLPWYGWLAHCAVWDRALAPAEIADLAVVG